MAIIPRMMAAFADELEKIAAKVPVIHGTSGRWDVLKPAVSPTVLERDPNAQAVYVASDVFGKHRGISDFAHSAAKRHGGEPVIAHAKIDTKKGWMPFNLTPWGTKNIGDVDDARALVEELDTIPDRAGRGEIWKKLNLGIGSWRNDDLSAELKPSHYTDALPRGYKPTRAKDA